MISRKFMLSVMLLLAFVLAACGAAAPDAMSQDTPMPEPTQDDMMMHDTPMPEEMAEPTQNDMIENGMMMDETPMPDEGAMMEAPAWFDTSLKDVRSGEAFTINDFKGKVVLVETMAVWCTTCFQEQGQIQSLHEALGMRDDFISVSLDIDPNEDESALTAYTQKNGQFDWRYAITGADVARDIGNIYGEQFLNPPSAPIFVVDRHGASHVLPFGLKSADDLMKAIQPYLDENM